MSFKLPPTKNLKAACLELEKAIVDFEKVEKKPISQKDSRDIQEKIKLLSRIKQQLENLS